MNGSTNPILSNWYATTVRRVVASEMGIEEQLLCCRRRARAEVAFARQVAMYLTHVVFGVSYNEVATAFRRERSTVAHACAVVEDARDDLSFDGFMERLERQLEDLERIRQGHVAERCGRLVTLMGEALAS